MSGLQKQERALRKHWMKPFCMSVIADSAHTEVWTSAETHFSNRSALKADLCRFKRIKIIRAACYALSLGAAVWSGKKREKKSPNERYVNTFPACTAPAATAGCTCVRGPGSDSVCAIRVWRSLQICFGSGLCHRHRLHGAAADGLT